MQEYFLSNPYFYSLALTLIHFIWQGCLVALALKSALIVISNKNPQLRYACASFAMFACLILPFITFAVIYQPNNIAFTAPNHLMPLLASSSNYLQNNNNYWTTNIIEFLPYVSIVWLTIVMLLTFKLFIEIFMVNQLPKQSVMPADAKLTARFNQLVEKIQLSTAPRLLISLKTDVPMAIGWLKPVILLPASMLSGLTTAQLEMLILHELAHIRRHDYLVNFMQTIVALLLFFHPAVQWISKQMRNEREYCSDDIAVQHCGDAIAYAHTLADTATICSKHRHHTIPNMAMAASGGDLKQRVIRLVDHHCTPSNDVGKWLAATTIIISLFSFGAQQYLIPGLFEMGSTSHVAPMRENDFINHRNYPQTSLAETSIARLLLTGEADLSNSIVADNIQNQSSLIVQNIPVETPRHAIEKNDNIELSILLEESLSLPIKAQTTEKILTTKIITTKKVLLLPQINKQINHTSITANQLSFTTNSLVATANKASSADINAVIMATNKQSQANEKSMKALAFDKTASNNNDSTDMKNPYAEQIATLNAAPESIISEFNNSLFTTNTHLTLDDEINALFPMDKTLEEPVLTNEKTQELITFQQVAIFAPTREKAELIRSIDPKYPSSAKRKGLELEVRVHFTIDKSGRIKNIEFEQQNKVSYFRNAIKTAMRKWYFNPAKIDGQPIESQMSKIFSFSLTG